MLFLTYWELNEGMALDERMNAARKLTEHGLFPPQGVNVLRWDATPDGWGILLLETESAAAVNEAITQWRAAGAGFFRCTRTAPAMPVQDAIAQITQIVETVGSV